MVRRIVPYLQLTAVFFVAATAVRAEVPFERITVERGPCLGTCPVYRFVMNSDGVGLFDGRKFTTASGVHRFAITPEEWSSFEAALRPFRPRGTEDITRGHPLCARMATDHPMVSVTWEDGDGIDHLRFNFGCHNEKTEAMADALANAPDLLPRLADLIERVRLEEGELHHRE
jgi:hypothetical protein